MSDTVLEMKGIRKSFGATHALKDVSFTVEKGEVHMLLGENGAGKSTLMKILAGSLAADAGSIYWEGKEIEITSPSVARNLGISMVYQELALVGTMTVMENILMGDMNCLGKTNILDKGACRKRAKDVLDRVGLGNLSMDAVVDTLSLGVRQLIEIAKGLSGNAKLLILDEPTSALTETEVDNLFGIIEGLQKEGISFIFITHKLEEVFRIGSRVSILRDGEVIGETKPIGEVEENDMITRMVGREITEFYPKEYNTKDDGEVLMEVNGLTNYKYFHDVSFKVKKGEVLGLAGLVGSGTTEIVEAIFGLKRIDEGSITFLGKPYEAPAPYKSLRRGIGMLAKDRKHSLLLHMPIYCNIALSNAYDFVRFKIVRLQKKERTESEIYAKKLRLKAASVQHLASSLSGGNQQKVVISRLLCAKCKLFIMDDPTRGIDVGAKIDVYNAINELTAEGNSVILISSQLPELLGISDRILVARDGTIAGEFDARSCTQEEIMSIIAGGEKHECPCYETSKAPDKTAAVQPDRDLPGSVYHHDNRQPHVPAAGERDEPSEAVRGLRHPRHRRDLRHHDRRH